MPEETTKILFFLVCSVVTILFFALVPYSWLGARDWFLPERITNTRWYRVAMRVVVIVLLEVLAYVTIILGHWQRQS